ncbi:glycosyltransferase family 4 protein [Albirhodobacter sp. R86504]|uniref:glycosyltransferase family 4 protein n=1 Tax=Albirhodobacter sp. R86504 TaxID=3093848 RepID=UPI00366EB33A
MKTLQIGLEWMPERAGGLPRYYYESWQASHGLYDFRGLVIGSDKVAKTSDGEVIGFAPASAPLLQRMAKARQSARAIIADWKPDLLVSHFALTTLPVLGVVDAPLVQQFHGPWALEGQVEGHRGLRYSLKKWTETRVYHRATRAITLSNAFADVLARDYGYPADRIDVIPGGVNVSNFNIDSTRSASRRRLGWPEDRPIVVAVRRLVPRMGLETLIDAAAVLSKRHSDFLIKIAGKGRLAESLQARITALGLENNVELLGFVPDEDLPHAYRAADLSIVPTQSLEGFGLIALEALAAGTPVLVSPVGGLPEVVTDLDNRLILPSPRCEDIVEGLEAALYRGEVPSSADCLAHAEQFDWKMIATRLRDCYAKAMA